MNDPRIPHVSAQSFAYRDLQGRDMWPSYTPSRSGWTDVGTPTVTAKYHITGRSVEGWLEIVPSTTVETTAGTSYISLPLDAVGYGAGVMQNVTTNVAIGNCVIDKTNSRLYVPTQAATGDTLVIWFSYEV